MESKSTAVPLGYTPTGPGIAQRPKAKLAQGGVEPPFLAYQTSTLPAKLQGRKALETRRPQMVRKHTGNT